MTVYFWYIFRIFLVYDLAPVCFLFYSKRVRIFEVSFGIIWFFIWYHLIFHLISIQSSKSYLISCLLFLFNALLHNKGREIFLLFWFLKILYVLSLWFIIDLDLNLVFLTCIFLLQRGRKFLKIWSILIFVVLVFGLLFPLELSSIWSYDS